MVCEPPRPQVGQLPHPKSKRSRRRSRSNRHAQRNAERLRAADAARAKVAQERRDAAERERAFFAQWPASVYPGPSLPPELGKFNDKLPEHPTPAQRDQHERQAVWLRMFKRWQKVRERFIKFHARTIDDKVIIYRTSIMYRDMRYWMARRCGFDANHKPTWDWWTGAAADGLIGEHVRLWFVDASRGKGMYFNQRRAWVREQKRRAA